MKKGLTVKQKLIATSLTMLIGLLLLAGTTFAWLTISTNPEITGMTLYVSGPDTLRLARHVAGTDPEFLDYHETLNLTDLFSQYTDLIPVSTADLLNWYLPTYNDDGTLKNVEEFIHDDTLKYANIGRYQLQEGQLVYESSGILYTEAELRNIYSTAIDSEAILSSALANPEEISLVDMIINHKTGYYVYADMWMTTDNPNGSIVRLSYPNYGVETATERKEMQGAFGTYVMPKLALNGTNIVSLSRNSETSVRLGFLIYGDAEDSSAITDWYIYEPNADKHEQQSKKPTGMNSYVLGYAKTAEREITNGMYVKTYPIPNLSNPTWSDLIGSHYYYDAAGTAEFIDPAHYLVQLSSVWNYGTDTKAALGLNKKLNSTYLSSFGKFVKTSELFNLVPNNNDITAKFPASITSSSNYTDAEAGGAATLATSNISEPLFEIEKDQYVKIRMFVWIEGQDVDCWNDVASGSFIVNLEFSENDLHAVPED